jgi:hypothetical protein
MPVGDIDQGQHPLFRSIRFPQKLWTQDILRRTGLSRSVSNAHYAADTVEPKLAIPKRSSKDDASTWKLAG